MEVTLDDIREQCEASLLSFIKVVAPHRVLGSVHEELIEFLTRPSGKKDQLTLLPRDHQKSAIVAYWVAWSITVDPTITIMYVSGTMNLAEKQLKFIKDILTSKTYTKLWPTMVNPEEGKREKWTTTEFAVDHPLRKEEGVRDPTVWATGVGGTQTGMHCKAVVFDDMVVPENAYTMDGRKKVDDKYSDMASIASTNAVTKVVGTRYHPKDLYDRLINMEEEEFEDGQPTGRMVRTYEVFERQVEDQGDGFGEFLWPRQRRKDGQEFGFNAQELARKRAKYGDKGKFRAQYYNDPNDPDDAPIQRDSWQYYDKKHLKARGGTWYFNDKKLNIFAAVDFAFSRAKKADYTAAVVIGVDEDYNYFVLDIERFKSDKIRDYFDCIEHLYERWQFKKIRLEVTVAQQAIVTELKNLIKTEGMLLYVDEHRPNRHEGNKLERIQTILEPRYGNAQMYHYRGGNCQALEEELVLRNPPHDDIKDALAAAMDLSKAPKKGRSRGTAVGNTNVITHKRFGGIIRL